MKTKYTLLLLCLLIFSVFNDLQAQETEEAYEPVYITMTKIHGVGEIDLKAWKEVEQEYFDNVIMNNDLVLSHEVLVNYFTPNFADVVLISTYRTWADIEDANAETDLLIEQAWPNTDERSAFFEKMNSFYSNHHSDEIYITTRHGKKMAAADVDKAKVYYMDVNILSDNDDPKSVENYDMYVKNVIDENDYVKEYYPFRHYFGSDSREFIEFVVVDSLSDLDKALTENKNLMEKFIPDATKREDFLNVLQESITSHKEVIYKNVPSLSK